MDRRHDNMNTEEQKAATVSFSPHVLSRSPTFTGIRDFSVTPTVSTDIDPTRLDSRFSQLTDFPEVNIISGRGLCSKNPYYPKDLPPGVDENTIYGYPKYGYPDSSYPPEGIYPSSEFPPNRPGRHTRQIYLNGHFSKTAFHDLLEEDDLTIFQSQPFPEIQGNFKDHYPNTNPSA